MILRWLDKLHGWITIFALLIEFTPLKWVIFPFWGVAYDLHPHGNKVRLDSVYIHILFVKVRFVTKWTKYKPKSF